MKVNRFIFSPFEVNTYILYDDSKECIIIDPACYLKKEEEQLAGFIADKELKPVRLINTHSHLDHVFGNKFVSMTYGLKPEAHKEEKSNNDFAVQAAENYGLTMAPPPSLNNYLSEDDQITFGNSRLKILHCPGHSKGSLVFHSPEHKFVIGGDVLFKDSIGRTDLPGGNFDTLKESIVTKLYTLDEATTVFSGHGPETTVGNEKRNNPFITF
ncbi:MAG: MBL fold metallo-hydrolase [Bacteroidota bacterium]|nr:MBL fold metallo-hydrolase [Bacteroidota bacterium]